MHGSAFAMSPFFRFPGLGRSRGVEAYAASHGLMVWSADFLADDWTHISGQQVLHRALQRLEEKRKGILLLHDIQPATALMLPQLLRELKARGYRVVQVVPAGPDRGLSRRPARPPPGKPCRPPAGCRGGRPRPYVPPSRWQMVSVVPIRRLHRNGDSPFRRDPSLRGERSGRSPRRLGSRRNPGSPCYSFAL